MRVNCTTCLELILASDECLATGCGHMFHSACILKWISNKATCPQCRASCRESTLRRIYITEAQDVTVLDEEASDDLRRKVDSMAFDLRITKSEKNKIAEELGKEKATNIALRSEFREIEREKNLMVEKVADAKTQLRYAQLESRNVKHLEDKARELKAKLESYQDIDLLVKETGPDVNKRLHEVGDFSEASKQLSIIIEALKKEMKAKKEDCDGLRQELKSKTQKISQLKIKLAEQERDVAAFKRNLACSRDNVKALEDTNESLRTKIERLSTLAMTKQKDEKKLKRVLAESPAPNFSSDESFKENENDDTRILDATPPLPDSDSPFLLTTSNNLVGLDKKTDSANPLKRSASQMTDHRELSSLQEFNILKKKTMNGPLLQRSESVKTFNDIKGQFYNGVGGHAPPDNFPTPLSSRLKLSKKPKGVSRPQSKIATSASSKMSQKCASDISKFFSLDTP